MPYKTVVYDIKDHVAYITLNQPEADNLINMQLAQEMDEVCRKVKQDDGVYAVVISGAGDKAFCSGSELERAIPDEGTAEPGKRYSVAGTIAEIEQPVIAAINGDALGQGLEIALSCDIRITVEGARFGLPQVSCGLMPMDGGTQRLPRLVGRGKALELVLSGDVFDAKEAYEIGLVSVVVPRQDLVSETEKLAQTIAGKAPIALKYIKEAVNKGLDLTLEQGLRLEADLYFLLHTTADRTEGIRAFREKRVPHFRAR
jgi:enoyl-CoA hydratase